jgi:DNA-binding response OmpR family regulator
MKKIRVVAIDDVGDILDIIAYNLNKEGMEVSTFTNSSLALEAIAQNPPDIIVSDWMMPYPDGLEVCRTVKSSTATANIPLIMLTCKGRLQDHKEAIDAGAQDYVVKPVRMNELVRRIKLALP